MQEDLFTPKAPPARNLDAIYGTPKVPKPIYYLAKSALQKCIRRGLADQACRMAWYMERFNKGSVRRRLPVIAAEDVSFANLALMARVLDALRVRGGYSTTFIDRAVGDLAESVKCRDLDDVWQIQGKARAGYMTAGLDCAEFRSIVGDFTYSIWSDDQKAMFLSHPTNHICDEAQWVCRMMSAFRADIGINYACVGTQLAKARDFANAPRVVEDVLDTPCLDASGHFPEAALDTHVFGSRRALESIANRNGASAEVAGLYLFLTEGARLDRRAVFECDYRAEAVTYAKGLDPAAVKSAHEFLLGGHRRRAWISIARDWV